MTDDEKTFLVSIKAGQPNWNVLGIEGIENLPAIQWKLANIKKIPAKRQKDLMERLRRTLGM